MKMHAGELIGEEVEVLGAANKFLVGLRGKIVDETKMAFTLLHNGTRKIILKNAVSFRLLRTLRIIEGRDILKRPEDKLKG